MNEREYFDKKNKNIMEFIHLYKSMPCLWQVKSKEYHMRELRSEAYTELIKKLREIDPTADRISVVKKINNLRCSLRKEKRKVLDLAKEGVVHQPRLWYYSLFDFLGGQERATGDNESEEENAEQNLVKREDGIEVAVKYEETTEEDDDGDPLESFEKSQGDEPLRIASPSSPPLKKPKKLAYEFAQATSSSSKMTPKINKILNYEESNYESREVLFGKNVAAKLKNIALKDSTQRLMAEKIINDALFMAEMGQLTMAHCNKLHAE